MSLLRYEAEYLSGYQIHLSANLQINGSPHRLVARTVGIANLLMGGQFTLIGYRLLLASLISGGAVVRQGNHVMTATLGVIGLLFRFLTRTLPGGVGSLTGAILKQVSRTISARLDNAAVLIRRVPSDLTATLVLVGSNIRSVSRALTSSMTSVGRFTWTFQRNLVGSLTPVASNLIRRGGKAMTAVLTPTGVIPIRYIVHQLSDSLNILTSFTVSGITFMGLDGALTITGSVTRRIAHSLVGSFSTTGVILRAIVRGFTGQVGLVGVMMGRSIQHVLIGGFTQTGSLARDIVHTLVGALSATGITLRLIQRHLISTNTYQGTFGHILGRSLTAALVITGYTTRTFERTFISVLSYSVALTRQTRRSMGATVTFTASAFHKTVARMLGATQSFANRFTKTMQRILPEAVLDLAGLLPRPPGLFHLVRLSAGLHVTSALEMSDRLYMPTGATFAHWVVLYKDDEHALVNLTDRQFRLEVHRDPYVLVPPKDPMRLK